MHQGRKVALVTGARTGVGFALTHKLLNDGWDVAVLVRSPLTSSPKIDTAIASGRLREYHADLADFLSLRSAIEQILAKEPVIDALFNNAGVSPGTFQLSPQGRELCFDVNSVIPYILSQELLPLLRKSARPIIVNTSSNALLTVKTFDPDRLGRQEQAYKKLFGAYARSKLALSLWTMEAALHFSEQGVPIVSACPGPIKSPMTASDGMPALLKIVAKFLFKPPSVGAEKLYDIATRDEAFPPGSFIINGAVRPLPFGEHAKATLTRISDIFASEFAKYPVPA